MIDAHNDRIRDQFRLQAATFTDSGFAANGLDWIVEILAPQPGDQALDVACGAGHLARALSPRVSHVSAIDLTPEMLAQGHRLARDAGLRNVVFAVGDATMLPWVDGQFDLVVCRLTVHQVADPHETVAEMVRVTRPGGRIGVTDMVLVDDDPAVAEENTRLERLRDPSHGRTRSVSEIESMLTAAGAHMVSVQSRDMRMDLEDWLARTQTPDHSRAEIRARLDDEIGGGRPTGLRPSSDADGRWFTHRWASLVATR